ncbi:hypothetical protein ACFXGG_24765 [Streptomyces nigra]|uniref:hypothetical protein n=1 Tax=Streptomyces nigra TaxID=1827580 RepID=UPI003684F2D5
MRIGAEPATRFGTVAVFFADCAYSVIGQPALLPARRRFPAEPHPATPDHDRTGAERAEHDASRAGSRWRNADIRVRHLPV